MPFVRKRNLLELWKDVIFALLLRHLTSKFNDKFGVSWLIIQPIVFILALSIIRGRLDGGDIFGLPPFIFLLLGFLPVIQFIQAWTTVSSAINKDKPLYAFRQVQPMASLVTTVIVEFTTYLLVLTVLTFIAIMIGQGMELSNPLLLLFYTIEIQLLGYCLGVLFAVGRLFIRELEKVQSLLQRPLIFISGTFFTLNDLPPESWVYFTWNPLLHGVELSRVAANSNFPQPSAISDLFFHMVVLFFLFLSLAVYAAFWKKGIAR